MNLNKCRNLRNLASQFNEYRAHNFNCLCNIKRFHSTKDSYYTKDCCMLEELFKRNKLEFVDIYTEIGRHIILDMVLANNI